MASPMRDSLNGVAYVDEDTEKMVKSWATSAAATSSTYTLTSMLISIFFNTSLDTIWIMINFIQMVALMPMQPIYYHQTVYLFLEKLMPSHMEFSFLPNVLAEDILEEEKFTVRPRSIFFEFWDHPSSSFILNSGKKLFLILLILLSWPFVSFMDNRYADKHPYCQPWRTLHKMFTYTLPLRFFMLAYLSFTLSCTLNMLSMPFETFADLFSAILALAVATLLMYAPVFLLWLF